MDSRRGQGLEETWQAQKLPDECQRPREWQNLARRALAPLRVVMAKKKKKIVRPATAVSIFDRRARKKYLYSTPLRALIRSGWQFIQSRQQISRGILRFRKAKLFRVFFLKHVSALPVSFERPNNSPIVRCSGRLSNMFNYSSLGPQQVRIFHLFY